VQQVGYGYGNGTTNDSALFWSGSASSAVDLASLLPSGYTWYGSQAISIDSAGNVYGIAYADEGVYAVEWTVPEPASLSMLIASGLIAARRRRRA
jgi:hypothetical protein